MGSLLRAVTKTLQAIWRRRRFEDELAEEMRFHMEARAADLQQSGASKAHALRQARIEMGAWESYKEACREARGLRWLDEFRLDWLYALRGLRRNKGFTVVAVATLSLGIGANAGIFTLVNSVLWKTLPVPDPQQLQAVYWELPIGRKTFHRSSDGRSMQDGSLRVADMFAYPHFARLRTDLASKVDLFGHMAIGRVSVTVQGQAQIARGLATSWNYFRALGVPAHLGRTFVPEDEDIGSPAPAVLLSHGYWSRAFAGDSSILGQPLNIGTQKAVVVGIMPPGFQGILPGESADVVLTLTAWDRIERKNSLANSRRWWVKMMGRLEPGFSPVQLRSELETRLIAMLRAEPVREPYDTPRIRLVDGARGLHWLRREFEKPLGLVMLTALVILLMAVLNVSGLLLARSEARVPETSARLALGAGRLRMARQSLTESLLLALIGLAGGLLFAAVLGRVLPTLLAQGGEAPMLDLAPDARFIAIASAVTVAVAFLSGIYPAWRSSRMNVAAGLKRGSGRFAGRLPLGRILVGTQIGLSLVLLIAAGTFVRTVSNLRSSALGFVPDHLLVFTVDPSLAGYQGDRLLAFYDRALRSLSAAPGARSASLARNGLLQGPSSSSGFYYRDPNGKFQSLGETRVHNVASGYFHTVGIPLLSGRDVRSSDNSTAKRVILVNETLARHISPEGRSPIGQFLFEDDKGQRPGEIVGVVGDAKYNEIRKAPPMTVYMALGQTSTREATFFVKTNADPKGIATVIRHVMGEVDPHVPIYNLRTQEEQLSLAIERERVLAKLLGAFATLALLLAAIGVYGVLSYSVARRTAEIGIRLALGAAPEGVRAMIARDSLRPVALGAVCGLGAAWGFTRLLEGFLFGVEPMDRASVIAALMILALVVSLAVLIPALRASRIHPAVALRYE